jgi:hypothetical protein
MFSNIYKLSIFVCLILSSCNSCKLPGYDEYMWRTIKNNSSEKIKYTIDFRVKGDTSIAKYPFDYDTFRGINTYGLIKEYDENRRYERLRKFFKESPDKVYMVFIFSYDSLSKLPWAKIRDNYMVLKRYDLTLDELERTNGTIIYP